MSFDYNATGVKPSDGEYTPLPDGVYDLKIIKAEEKTTKNGDPMVVVDFEVVNNPDFSGKKIKFHNVAFVPRTNPGAGIPVHFLKTIGEPWEGAYKVQPQDWLGKFLKAKVGIREYEGKQYNNVTMVMPYEAEVAVNGSSDKDVPF